MCPVKLVLQDTDGLVAAEPRFGIRSEKDARHDRGDMAELGFSPSIQTKCR